MMTFENAFCAARRCAPNEFGRKLFWACLYPHAWPIAVIAGGFASNLFSADRELLNRVAGARTVPEVREEITDYFLEAGGSLRHRLRLRISTTRLKQLAKQHLPGADSRAPIDSALPE